MFVELSSSDSVHAKKKTQSDGWLQTVKIISCFIGTREVELSFKYN